MLQDTGLNVMQSGSSAPSGAGSAVVARGAGADGSVSGAGGPAEVEAVAGEGPRGARAGLVYGLAAYVWWGLSPGYFKALAKVPAMVVLGHRVVWSVLLLVVLLTALRQWGEVRAIVRDRRMWLWLIASTLLIAVNWLVYIYAVGAGRLIESSLGYFVNPLFTVVLAMVFLKERLRPAQWVAVAIATGGLVYLTIARGGLPWIAIVLPAAFGLYGLIRKKAPVSPLAGIFVETGLLAPAAVAYLAWAHTRPEAAAMHTPALLGLLSLAGVVTTVPLLWFIAASKRLPLVTMGFLQYINPTLQFLTAVLVFGEPFGKERAIAFGVIWVAVGVFAVDAVRGGRMGSGESRMDRAE